MARLYRGAIVGCGNVACQGHIPAWQRAKTFQIVAAVDPVPEHRSRVCALLPHVRTYDCLATLLDHEGLDFLDICTPPAMHEAAIVQAATRGLHVLCEKPLTISATAWRQITAAVASAGILVFPVHNWRYAPHFRLLKTLLTAQIIGRPRHIELVTLRHQPAGPNGWRLDPKIAGGGILLDHGWHAFYLLLFLLGALPWKLTARLEKRRLIRADVEDTATCEIWFPQATAHVHLTWASAQRCNRVTVQGEGGVLCLEDRHLVIQTEGLEPYTIDFSSALSAGSYHPDWFAALLPAFRDAISAPGPYDDYLHEPQTCLSMALHAYRSATGGGQPVALAKDTIPELI